MAHMPVYKSCRNSRYQRTLLFKRLDKDNGYNPISPSQCCCDKFQERFLQLPGELELLVAHSGVGLGNPLINCSHHKLFPPSSKLTAIWGSATGLGKQENQDFFHLCFISMCDLPQIRNGFRNRENSLWFMTERVLAEHCERVFSELCKHGNPLLSCQKEKNWREL